MSTTGGSVVTTLVASVGGSVTLASVSGVTLGSTSVALVSSKATETTKATLVVT